MKTPCLDMMSREAAPAMRLLSRRELRRGASIRCWNAYIRAAAVYALELQRFVIGSPVTLRA